MAKIAFYKPGAEVANQIVAYYTTTTDFSKMGLTRLDDPLGDLVVGVEVRHHKIVVATITEMTQVEKDATDLARTKRLKKRDINRQTEIYIGGHYTRNRQIILNTFWIEGLDKKWTTRTALIQTVLDWIETVLDEFYAKRTDVQNAIDEAAVAAITLNLSQFDTTDPEVKVETVRNTET